MTARKHTPAPLSLPERPPSKVEQGLAAEQGDTTIVGKVDAERTEQSAEELRERAIDAMVAAGLSREFAEASFVLAEDNATAADVAEAVDEISTAPLCEHGCHGQSWADVPRELDAVACEHGSFARKPHSDK